MHLTTMMTTALFFIDKEKWDRKLAALKELLLDGDNVPLHILAAFSCFFFFSWDDTDAQKGDRFLNRVP